VATHIGIGSSSLADPAHAAKEAAAQAKNQLNVATTELVVVFTSISHAVPQVIEMVTKILQPKKIIGCSTAGIILADKISPQGVAVLAINSDDIQFTTTLLSDIAGKDMRQMGFQMARDLNAEHKNTGRQILTVFSDGGLTSGASFTFGAKEVFGNATPVVGAISSDNFLFKKTAQFYQGQILSNSAVGLLISGPITIAIGSKHGWKPLGKPRTIDKVDGCVIKTIDGKPAATLYENYFGEDAKSLKESRLGAMAILYPIGIYLEEERYYLLRNAIDILDDGSIVCQGEVPEGSQMHLMIGSKDSCKQAALDAALEVRDGLSGRQAKLILIIESMTRYKLLGRTAIQEIQIIKDVLGYTTPLIGMYSAGEIAPFQSIDQTKNTHLQNESIVIIAIG
jgi:hypothetical protein